ncbi:hypothetical protein [Bordetella tumbae]|uniref:hypothetical protein n=1 Tax=Bordetella tumbae TaxID=1649139 RepID=UPI0039F00A08
MIHDDVKFPDERRPPFRAPLPMQKGLDTRFCVFIAAAQYFFDETGVFIDEMQLAAQRNNIANSFFPGGIVRTNAKTQIISLDITISLDISYDT